MKIKSLQHAASVLLGFVGQRQKAYEAVHQQQKISSNHPAFGYCADLRRVLKVVADGNTQKPNVADVVKRAPSFYFIVSQKAGPKKANQLSKIDACITYMREQIYTTTKAA